MKVMDWINALCEIKFLIISGVLVNISNGLSNVWNTCSCMYSIVHDP